MAEAREHSDHDGSEAATAPLPQSTRVRKAGGSSKRSANTPSVSTTLDAETTQSPGGHSHGVSFGGPGDDGGGRDSQSAPLSARPRGSARDFDELSAPLSRPLSAAAVRAAHPPPAADSASLGQSSTKLQPDSARRRSAAVFDELSEPVPRPLGSDTSTLRPAAALAQGSGGAGVGTASVGIGRTAVATNSALAGPQSGPTRSPMSTTKRADFRAAVESSGKSVAIEKSGKSLGGGSSSGLVARSGKSVSAATLRKAFQSLGDTHDEESLELEDVKAALRNKTPPNQLLQLIVVIKRAAIKHFRGFYPTTVVDVALLMVAACVVGGIHGTGWSQAKAASNAVMAMTTLATLTGVSFLRTFVKVRTLVSS